jgi:hypothetical protein
MVNISYYCEKEVFNFKFFDKRQWKITYLFLWNFSEIFYIFHFFSVSVRYYYSDVNNVSWFSEIQPMILILYSACTASSNNWTSYWEWFSYWASRFEEITEEKVLSFHQKNLKKLNTNRNNLLSKFSPNMKIFQSKSLKKFFTKMRHCLRKKFSHNLKSIKRRGKCIRTILISKKRAFYESNYLKQSDYKSLHENK